MTINFMLCRLCIIDITIKRFISRLPLIYIKQKGKKCNQRIAAINVFKLKIKEILQTPKASTEIIRETVAAFLQCAFFY